MSGKIEGWTPELERSFKEVLFRFLEEVQSTKAALYLVASDGTFILATQYGFRGRDLLATTHVPADPILARLKNDPGNVSVANDFSAIPELATYLQGAGSARLMVVPIISNERLIGFVDARDKGRKRSFEEGDKDRAATISAAILDLVSRSRLYSSAAPASPPPRKTPSQSEAAPGDVGDASEKPHIALEAEVVSLQMEAGVASVLDRAGLARLAEEAMSVAHEQGVAAVALTVAEDLSAATVLLVGETSGNVDDAAIIRHQTETLREAESFVPHATEWRLEARRIAGCGDQTPARIIASAVLLSNEGWSLSGSVVAVLGSTAAAQGLRRLQALAEDRGALVSLRLGRRQLARRLLEPGAREYSELRAHSLAVSQLSWTLGRRLGLDEAETEEASLAGLLHDVGMRELRYDELYGLSNPTPEDRLEFRRHVDIGEKIVRGIGLERVATAVRHHHERWDGKGYPDRLEGAAIPILARLVHVAEVYDVLTSPSSYRKPVSPEKALAIMKAAAGHQFDPKMVELLGRAAE